MDLIKIVCTAGFRRIRSSSLEFALVPYPYANYKILLGRPTHIEVQTDGWLV